MFTYQWRINLEKKLEWVTFSSVSLDEERIFVGAEQGILCLGTKRGESYWKFDCGETVFNTPTVGHNRIFFGSSNGIFYCLHAETGGMLWKIETESRISSEAVIANKKVVFATDDGVLYIVKAISGKILESVELDQSGITCLALSDKQLFVG
ncbi:MAG: PQQ-binding-like beta-propeller repeat protein [Candidatus Methanofastidiosia archaeon]